MVKIASPWKFGGASSFLGLGEGMFREKLFCSLELH